MASHPPVGEAKNNLKNMMNIMVEIKGNTLDRFIVITNNFFPSRIVIKIRYPLTAILV